LTLSSTFYMLTCFNTTGPVHAVVDCMHRIKQVCLNILAEKIQEEHVTTPDIEPKKDLMSLLMRARQSETKQQDSPGVASYQMNDDNIVQQMACSFFPLTTADVKRMA
jgi:hypothetical protein